MQRTIIGVDPHKLSVTIEVVDHHEQVLAAGRLGDDKAGYAAMRKHVAPWPERTGAVEGSNGAGRLRSAAGRRGARSSFLHSGWGV
jgi:transposase